MPEEEHFYCWGQCRTMMKSSAAHRQETRPHQTCPGCHQDVRPAVQPQLPGLRVPHSRMQPTTSKAR